MRKGILFFGMLIVFLVCFSFFVVADLNDTVIDPPCDYKDPKPECKAHSELDDGGLKMGGGVAEGYCKGIDMDAPNLYYCWDFTTGFNDTIFDKGVLVVQNSTGLWIEGHNNWNQNYVKSDNTFVPMDTDNLTIEFNCTTSASIVMEGFVDKYAEGFYTGFYFFSASPTLRYFWNDDFGGTLGTVAISEAAGGTYNAIVSNASWIYNMSLNGTTAAYNGSTNAKDTTAYWINDVYSGEAVCYGAMAYNGTERPLYVFTLEGEVIAPLNNSMIMGLSPEFIVNLTGGSSCNLTVNGTNIFNYSDLNITGVNVFPSYEFSSYGGYNWSVACNSSGSEWYSDTLFFVLNQTVPIPSEYDVGDCPDDTTSSVLLFALFFVIALSLVFIAVVAEIAFMGVFGGLMLFVLSWYIAGCVGLFAGILMGLSIVLIIYFPLKAFVHGDGVNK